MKTKLRPAAFFAPTAHWLPRRAITARLAASRGF